MALVGGGAAAGVAVAQAAGAASSGTATFSPSSATTDLLRALPNTGAASTGSPVTAWAAAGTGAKTVTVAAAAFAATVASFGVINVLNRPTDAVFCDSR